MRGTCLLHAAGECDGHCKHTVRARFFAKFITKVNDVPRFVRCYVIPLEKVTGCSLFRDRSTSIIVFVN